MEIGIMTTIELNEQQVEFLKEVLQDEVIDTANLAYGNTSKAIAQQIINKLEE